MKDLLKEAIADAKAVRETALANAKLALEEAFTPRIQSMLSAKLAEELEDGEEPVEEPEMEEPEMEVPAEEPEMEEPAEEPEMEEPAEEEFTEGEEFEDDDLDLDEIIRELEGDTDEEVYEEEYEEEMPEESEYLQNEEFEDDEEIDINEIVRALREEDEEMEEPVEEPESSEELEEAYNVIRFLKSKINEVNLLNAKLLYSNKLFRNFTLNEGQKMKVIENFDRAHSLREVKLVYSTLAEGFKMPSAKLVKESFASKPVASTKPAKQVITEGAELANRFKKLAGLK